MNIQEIQKKYDLSKEPNVDIWHHKPSGKWIITHDACEKIAYQEGIVLTSREVDNSEAELVRYWITMSMEDDNGETITVSSSGEADRNNCFSQYLGCMAEKRGIDRCILKLIRAYQYGISSEVEADDFKKPDRYTVSDEQKTRYQELLQSGCYEGEKAKINKWWKGFTTFEQAEAGLKTMENHVTKLMEMENHVNKTIEGV